MNLDVQKVAAKARNPVELMGGQLDLLVFEQAASEEWTTLLYGSRVASILISCAIAWVRTAAGHTAVAVQLRVQLSVQLQAQLVQQSLRLQAD